MRIEDPELLDELRHAPRCECCGRRTRTGADPHHIMARGMGDAFRLDIRENLIALCRDCHNKAHSGQITRVQLITLVTQREEKTTEAVLELLYRLRNAPKGTKR